MHVGLSGSGVAATTCAHLLAGAGFQVAMEDALRPPVPTILLSDAALALMRGLFDRPALLADRPRIDRRLVAWGGEAVTIPHGAALASEEGINDALKPPVAGDAPPSPVDFHIVDFHIHAAPPLPAGELHIFGERNALATHVRLRRATCGQEARVEAVADGWLFLVPAEAGFGWLLGVGGALDRLLAQSRLIAPVVDMLGATSTPFLAAPRIHLPLCGDDWLACGTAALGFDPICGDGTAQSVREAILASAVLVAIAEGGDRDALLTHYRSMLIAAMRRHLQICAQFYASGGQGDWWRAQHDALMQGYRQCTGLLARLPEPRFMLDGLRLVSRRQAA